jgi:hypothetical protein
MLFRGSPPTSQSKLISKKDLIISFTRNVPFLPLFHSLEKSNVVHFPPVLLLEQTGTDIKLHEPFCVRGGNTDSKDPGPVSRVVSPSEPVRTSVSIHTPIHVIIPDLIDISLCVRPFPILILAKSKSIGWEPFPQGSTVEPRQARL